MSIVANPSATTDKQPNSPGQLPLAPAEQLRELFGAGADALMAPTASLPIFPLPPLAKLTRAMPRVRSPVCDAHKEKSMALGS